MHTVKQLEIFTEFRSNILRLTVSGWLSADTVNDLNDEVSCHSLSAAVVLDVREAVITLGPRDVHLFTAMAEAPLVYVALPEQGRIVQPWMRHRRRQGYTRGFALSLQDATTWLKTLTARPHATTLSRETEACPG